MSIDSNVVIVGAGPAGLSAADVLRNFGLEPIVIDEQPRMGGQILRQPPRTFSVDHWLPQKFYKRVKSVLSTMEKRVGIDWRFGSTALGILQHSAYRRSGALGVGTQVWIKGPSGCELVQAGAVLIASGCYERPLGFPGWTLPGVMGAGAIQAFVKGQQFVSGERFVLVGSHPLQLVVADQLVAAGATVAAIVFTQQPLDAAGLFRHPLAMLLNGAPLVETARILWRLRSAGVRVMFGRTVVRAEGMDQVERATIAKLQPGGAIDTDNTQTIACDRIGICHGFLASSELARQAGASVQWRESEGGWIVDHNEWFQTSVANLFVAGEVTGVAGADAALEKGRIAAAGILRALGRIDDITAQRLVRRPRLRLRHLHRFARVLSRLARPPRDLADETMTEDTVLCRCESITCGEFRSLLQENEHVLSADGAKLLTRVGMGMCQGRLCGDRAVHMMASIRGVAVTDVGPFHVQAPVKPVLLDALPMCSRRNEDEAGGHGSS
jgi:NADPH-dependent 2,4-dienoyl-CoA reductase/sulfur reductase-like enzyme